MFPLEHPILKKLIASQRLRFMEFIIACYGFQGINKKLQVIAIDETMFSGKILFGEAILGRFMS